MNQPFDVFHFEDFFTFGDLDMRCNYWLLPFPDPQIKYPDIITDLKEFSNTYVVNKVGKNWTDLIYCGWPNLLVVSEQLYDSLHGSTGINFYPVNILNKELKLIPVNYYGFHVTGRCGSFINSLCRSEMSKRTPEGPEFVKKIGLYFDPDTWDKSDFFIAEETAMIVISKRVYQVIKRNKFTNVDMKPITEVETF